MYMYAYVFTHLQNLALTVLYVPCWTDSVADHVCQVRTVLQCNRGRTYPQARKSSPHIYMGTYMHVYIYIYIYIYICIYMYIYIYRERERENERDGDRHSGAFRLASDDAAETGDVG